MAQTNDSLPDGWVWTTLGEIQRDDSQSIVPSKLPRQSYELYSVPSYDDGRPEITPGGEIGSNKQTVVPNTVLLCKINPRINRVWTVGSHSDWPQIASTEWIPFFPLDGIAPEFLRYYMCRHEFRDFLAANASGVGGSLMRVRPATLQDYPFPLAPLAEQRRIVAAIEAQLTRLDAGVAALKRAQARLRRYKAAVLKAACEGRLVPQDPADEPADALLRRILAERRARWEADELARLRAKGKEPLGDTWQTRYAEPQAPDPTSLPLLPQGWVWVTLEVLATDQPNSITDGPFGSKLKTEHYTSSGPRVIRLQNIGDGTFRDEKAHISLEHFGSLKRHEVLAGDLVIAGLGEDLPRACIIPDGVGPAIVKADCIRLKPDMALTSSRYLNAALNSDVLKRIAQNIIHGVGRPRLNQQEIRSLTIPLPPLAEQARIVAEVERRLSVVDEMDAALRANLARADRLRQAILQRAFAGQLVPQDPADEPARALLERIRAERGAASVERGARRPGRRQRATGETAG